MKHFFLLGYLLCWFVLPASAQLTYAKLRVQYDSVWTYKNLQLIPIRFKDKDAAKPTVPPPAESMTLVEAMQNSRVKVREIDGKKGGDVNWLEIKNRSKEDIFITSGQVVSGGKQDRVMAETKVIAAGSTDYVKVYCIEKGRWDRKPKGFKHRGSANVELRKVMDRSKRQSTVWKEIDNQLALNNRMSSTASYLKLFKDAVIEDTGYINFFTRKYRQSDSAFAGFVAVTGNRIICTDLFATTRLNNLAYPSILASYVRTAVGNGAPPTISHEKLKTFLDKLLTDEPSQKKFIATNGKMDVANGKIVHLVAYE
ncbi:MAG: hypothetical protein JWQ96_2446 [Segetibacter sp.]|nr:hypothetical protein [Segetibacter sp.]